MTTHTPHTLSDFGSVMGTIEGDYFHTTAGAVRQYLAALEAEYGAIEDGAFIAGTVEDVLEDANMTERTADSEPVTLLVRDWSIEPIVEPLCHAVGSPSPSCRSCGYGAERRSLDRDSRAYASQYVGTDGMPVYGAFTLTDERASAWLTTGSLSEARTVAYLHNSRYGFTS